MGIPPLKELVIGNHHEALEMYTTTYHASLLSPLQCLQSQQRVLLVETMQVRLVYILQCIALVSVCQDIASLN